MNISIVIPMYNAAATIVATVESCLCQSLNPIEIIIVDDGSTDNCREIVLQNFGDKVQLIALASNQGPSAARNKGWNQAKGDYIAFLDSDDQWHPQKLEIFSKVSAQEKELDVWWHSYSSNELKEQISNHKTPIPIKARKIGHLLSHNSVSSSAVIFRKTLPIRWEESMRYCEDYNIALISSYRFNTFESQILLTRIGRPILSKGGASAQKWKMRKGEISCYWNLGQLNFGFYFLFPFLLLWSLIKHLRILIIRR